MEGRIDNVKYLEINLRKAENLYEENYKMLMRGEKKNHYRNGSTWRRRKISTCMIILLFRILQRKGNNRMYTYKK